MTDMGRKELDEALDGLQRQAPECMARAIRWLRTPKARWFCIPVGVLFIIGSFFWFLPVLGIEMLPIGLLLIAQDVPFVRKPVGRTMIWLERHWDSFRQHRRERLVRRAQEKTNNFAR